MNIPIFGCHTISTGTVCAQLVEVINEDYADFVSLSTKLVNVDGAVLRMQNPLQELRVRPAALWHMA